MATLKNIFNLIIFKIKYIYIRLFVIMTISQHDKNL